ncbi:MAG: hypothetical protein Gaeavirus12_11 [Gaeavirus sp.]|uniref:Uncharacterized protein n=1 Tax=Gaeavirus sp. TaxID=2487767 RepID=A0A3G5A2V3_9VIRU|nr:MAG: hypothetical protein Gaeavirus12_11 [Gaeavirus sp.]
MYHPSLVPRKTKSVINNAIPKDTNIEPPNPKPKPTPHKTSYWEYGNRAIKISNFDHKMKKNITILNNIDILFNEFINTNIQSSYTKLSASNITHKLKSGTITSSNKQVYVILPNNKHKYKIIDISFTTISKINITDKDLHKNNIPNFVSALKHKDNTYHVSKIIRLLQIPKYTITENNYNKNNTHHKIATSSYTHITELIKTNSKDKILKSTPKTAFYIKLYNDGSSKAFVINNNKIHYIAININTEQSYINTRTYTLELTNHRITKY